MFCQVIDFKIVGNFKDLNVLQRKWTDINLRLTTAKNRLAERIKLTEKKKEPKKPVKKT